MQKLTEAGDQLVDDLSSRYNLSRDAVIHMLVAVNNGGCSMAQFSCPELGGSGQWMRGGMTMVGDMFNHGLKSTVDNLCNELANGLTNLQVFPVIPAGSPNSSQWWPSDCGVPSSSGAQNNTRYAVFPGKLAVQINGQVTVYDTLNHNIGGVSQQQGGDNSLTFSSQFGTISVSQLPVIPMTGSQDAITEDYKNTNFVQPDSSQMPQTDPTAAATNLQQDSINIDVSSSDEVIELIAKLAKLRDANAITEEDFNTKKIELLARI